MTTSMQKNTKHIKHSRIMFVVYVCHVLHNLPFNSCITCIYLEYAEYSGMFHAFCFCYVSKHFPFYGGIASIYLKYVEYSGIFFFVFVCIFLSCFTYFSFLWRQNQTQQRKIIGKSPFRRTSSCKWRDVSMQGNTFLEGKNTCTEWETTASCGTLCLYIYIHIARI